MSDDGRAGLRDRLDVEGFSVGTWGEPETYTHAIEIDEAIKVFAAWLREEATALAMAEETTENHWYRFDDDSCSCDQWADGDGSIHAQHVARVGLAFLADTLDPKETP